MGHSRFSVQFGPRYSLTIIWLKIKHFEKQIVFVDLAVNTPLKLVVSYCDNAPISSVLVLRPSQIWKYAMSHKRWLDFLYVEQSLLEQLTLFSNVSIVLEDVDTYRSK